MKTATILAALFGASLGLGALLGSRSHMAAVAAKRVPVAVQKTHMRAAMKAVAMNGSETVKR
jgi:hypothetical protein